MTPGQGESPKNAVEWISQKEDLCWKKRGRQSTQTHYCSLQRQVCSSNKKVQFYSKILMDRCWRIHYEVLQRVEETSRMSTWVAPAMTRGRCPPQPTCHCSIAALPCEQAPPQHNCFPWETISAANAIRGKNSFKPFASSYIDILCMFSFGSCSSKSPQRHSFHTLPID